MKVSHKYHKAKFKVLNEITLTETDIYCLDLYQTNCKIDVLKIPEKFKNEIVLNLEELKKKILTKNGCIIYYKEKQIKNEFR